MVEEVGRQVGSLPRTRNLFCFHHICAVLLLNSSSALLIADQRVSCKSTELDLVSTETWLSFWESEVHKLVCSVFASVLIWRHSVVFKLGS